MKGGYSTMLNKLNKDKRGVLGMGTAGGFLLGMLTLAIIGVAVLITLNALNNTSVATSSTTNVVGNVSSGVDSFFSNSGTWFSLLAIVVIILIISVVIFAVQRFGGSAGNDL